MTTVRTEVNSNLIVAAALTSVIMLVGFVHAPLMPVVAGAAIAPMIPAPIGLTNAHGAVIATSPASMPLHSIVGSGLRPLKFNVRCAAIAAVMLASIVLTTTKLMRRSVPASVEPGLNPNQPKARMNVPRTTIGMSCPGIACGLP